MATSFPMLFFSAHRASLCLFAFCLLNSIALAQTPAPGTVDPGIAFIRYDDNSTAFSKTQTTWYEHFKYTPLGSDPNEYISFGGNIRERYELYFNPLLGLERVQNNDYLLQRVLLHANLQVDNFRAFVQLGSYYEWGREPSALPTDIDRVDLPQAFVDYKIPLDDGTLTLRGGRAELTFDNGAYISLRDGPNVRQSFDGFRAFYQKDALQVDAFAVKPVDVKPKEFDDDYSGSDSLWGLHLTTPLFEQKQLLLNAFYYGSSMHVSILPGVHVENTETLGAILQNQIGSWSGSVGGAGQVGSLENKDVRAFSLHGDVGYTFNDAPTQPNLSARIDALSGGDNKGGTVRTFNALYPNYDYSTEAAIEAPSNLIQTGLVATIHPGPRQRFTYTLEGLWRYSSQDAFYTAPDIPLVPPSSNHDRFSGIEQQVEYTWQINPYVSFAPAYVYFRPGNALRQAGCKDEQYFMSELNVQF